jgi:hypothetical protein
LFSPVFGRASIAERLVGPLGVVPFDPACDAPARFGKPAWTLMQIGSVRLPNNGMQRTVLRAAADAEHAADRAARRR